MSHEIYENRFVAVREPAWHRLGKVFESPIPPSQAVTEGDLDVVPVVEPLYLQGPNGPIDSGLIVTGRWEDGQFVVYGSPAKQFEVVELSKVLPELDRLAETFPLSSAGTLRKGSEIFFTFGVPDTTEIAGEAYKEYYVYRHSYAPGTANLVMYTPVRVVCNNTLITGERDASFKLSVGHTGRTEERTTAAIVIARAVRQADAIKSRLEALAKRQISRDTAVDILKKVYAPYAPAPVPASVSDLVSEDMVNLFNNPARAAYADRLVETTLAAYDRFNDEHPTVAGTAYALYQAAVEAADWRRGRASMVESAVVGARADEKVRAWNLISSLN